MRYLKKITEKTTRHDDGKLSRTTSRKVMLEMQEKKNYAIILASGISSRMGYEIPKQFIKVAGKMLVEHTIEVFEKNQNIDDVFLGVHSEYVALMTEMVQKNKYKKIKKIYVGGKTRTESAGLGVDEISDADANVLIHDAVRPFVSDRIIDDCISALENHQAVDVAIPSTDTIIEVNANSYIKNIPTRRFLMRGQTPQAFRINTIREAHRLARKEAELDVTDDCSLVLKYKLADIYVVRGEEHNIKVTYAEDVFLADKIFQLKSETASTGIDLQGLGRKVVVVFGSSRGIGREIAAIAEKNGAKTFGFSRHTGVDVSAYDQVEKALKSVYAAEKRIDGVIDTAGRLTIKKIANRSYDDILSEIKTNYWGAIAVAKASIPYLKETKGAMLFFTSSSYTRGRGGFAAYSSAKAAVVNLVQALAEELYEDQIRINAINPERTATPMRSENFGVEPGEALLKAPDVANISLRTLLSGLTGQVIDVRRTLLLEKKILGRRL